MKSYSPIPFSDMHYVANYDSSLLRGIDSPLTPRPWDLTKIILSFKQAETKKLLDVGCGTGFKLIPLSSSFERIIGLDPSTSMLQKARKLLNTSSISNIQLVRARGQQLPFRASHFDIVTCMLSRWDITEIARVLKKDGVLVIEHIGWEDKKNFKLAFGQDEKGWRGQYLNYDRTTYYSSLKQALSMHFKHIAFEEGYWETFYTEEGLWQLLENTPCIRNFCKEDDASIVKQQIAQLKTSQGICLQQHRVLLIASNTDLTVLKV